MRIKQEDKHRNRRTSTLVFTEKPEVANKPALEISTLGERQEPKNSIL